MVKVYGTGVLVTSCGENTVKFLFSNFTQDYIGKAFAATPLGWAYKLISLSNTVNEIADIFTVEENFSDRIINYCANTSQYDVYVVLANGETRNLQEINQAIASKK